MSLHRVIFLVTIELLVANVGEDVETRPECCVCLFECFEPANEAKSSKLLDVAFGFFQFLTVNLAW